VGQRSFISIYTIFPRQTLRLCTSTKNNLRSSVIKLPISSVIPLIINFYAIVTINVKLDQRI